MKAWLERREWIVYKPPDTYGAPMNCPTCHSDLYCRACAKEVKSDEGATRFTPYKPADLAVLRSPIGWGGWIEVKKVEARTESGMNYRPKYVKPHQAKAMSKTDGFLAVAFIQNLQPGKQKVVGTYLVRWSLIANEEAVTRSQFRELAEVTVFDSPEVVPEKVKKPENLLDSYLR